MTFCEDVRKFMELYASSEKLQKEYAEAEAYYPGSLEIRETVVEEVLIPFAKRYGFDFTLNDLRKYETKVLLEMHRDVELNPEDPDDDRHFWLLEHGWTDDESKIQETSFK